MSLHFTATRPTLLNGPFFFKPCDLLALHRFLRTKRNNFQSFLSSSVSSNTLVSTSRPESQNASISQKRWRLWSDMLLDDNLRCFFEDILSP